MPATRVLRMIARLNVGGPARHVVWLTDSLAREGFESLLVTGVVSEGEQDMTAFATAHGVTPQVISSLSREVSLRDLLTLWRVWRVMVRFRPDIVHTHTAKAGTIGRVAGLLYRFVTPSALIGRPRRARFVHTYHGHVLHGYYGPSKSRVFAAIERVLARLNTDRIVVLGRQQFDELHQGFGIGRAEQFAIVPLGIDLSSLAGAPQARQALRSELGIGPAEVVVGIVGRVTAIKNHDLFLRVAAMTGDLARFVVYGDGEDREGLEGRRGKVIFAGTRAANDVYASLDIVALTSRNEGTPLALIEAMALGKPVISTAVGGVVDLLGDVEERVAENGTAYEIRARGITVPSGDAPAFAAGLTRLLRDEELRRRLVLAGKPYIERTHTREQLVGAIIRLYRDIEPTQARRS
jgi:glycosyltransferase involved in cell wall biosynthesis